MTPNVADPDVVVDVDADVAELIAIGLVLDALDTLVRSVGRRAPALDDARQRQQRLLTILLAVLDATTVSPTVH